MNITTISLSYFFFVIFIVSAIFAIYFKLIVIKSAPGNSQRDKIIGKMKDPDTWRYKNNTLAYISIFWSVVSLLIFAYLKFYYTAGLVSTIYLFLYLAVIAISIFLVATKHITKSKGL